jgi:hypothetical protein
VLGVGAEEEEVGCGREGEERLCSAWVEGLVEKARRACGLKRCVRAGERSAMRARR